MIKLTSKFVPLGTVTPGKVIARVTTNKEIPVAIRPSHILLLDSFPDGTSYDGFGGVLLRSKMTLTNPRKSFPPNSFLIPEDQFYLGDGDILRLDRDRAESRTLYRRSAPQNSFLLTERCNSFCIMCSQPPKKIDDSYLIEEIAQAIPLVDKGTVEIGFTGGEPTLLGDELIRLIRLCKNNLPQTALHILSNGRNFKDAQLAAKVSSVAHPDLMFGIPVYSDIADTHDFIVQADGSFDETIRGILKLKEYGVKVEIRVVIHKANYQHLPRLAKFFTRNLLFVDHVALMGLELMGFAKANIDGLWIDPVEYQGLLLETVETLHASKMNVSIYNHQLCLLDKKIWRFARKSISDWKNEYLPECQKCSVRDQCGGLFTSGLMRPSPSIKAIDPLPERVAVTQK